MRWVRLLVLEVVLVAGAAVVGWSLELEAYRIVQAALCPLVTLALLGGVLNLIAGVALDNAAAKVLDRAESELALAIQRGEDLSRLRARWRDTADKLRQDP